jgi:osmotically-inducible protein OsmY
LEKSSRVLKGRPAAVIVNSGIVHLWGPVGSQEEHKALVALAEGVPGVVSAADEMIPAY